MSNIQYQNPSAHKTRILSSVYFRMSVRSQLIFRTPAKWQNRFDSRSLRAASEAASDQADPEEDPVEVAEVGVEEAWVMVVRGCEDEGP